MKVCRGTIGSQITDAQLTSSVGLCYPSAFRTDSNVGPIWPSTEEDCIGQTGYIHDFLNIANKIALENLLSNDNLNQEMKKLIVN